MVRYFDSGEPFPLERGGELPALRIAYHTYGEPNAARDNVVLSESFARRMFGDADDEKKPEVPEEPRLKLRLLQSLQQKSGYEDRSASYPYLAC